ncbi:MAG: hypothetical protein DYH04_08945 [Nitrospira sp. NTP2]|nr:hypothetical protein [Nitrospira sp. NTP2]
MREMVKVRLPELVTAQQFLLHAGRTGLRASCIEPARLTAGGRQAVQHLQQLEIRSRRARPEQVNRSRPNAKSSWIVDASCARACSMTVKS